ncbi:RbsD/FucU domain-containing protein [Rhodopirellula sp. SWK7]|uniref:RbsD/FucU domain-containing protein n=1 Tax=Rhodopirellula sp. SWK7 TaxID=595460 RepID=UPI0002BDBA87|nr:RbsD/FucU domain-containing protein [Rhodopirellula sp. SWK7]EMI43726.1 hypothetical protein RRSWK_03751 [Rhodopirellula sp. SWK7]
MTYCKSTEDWKEILPQRLSLLGHRNWIVIADAAYPTQTSPGIETRCTDADQVEVLRETLKEIESSSHVRPIVYLDGELPFLTEKYAPGIDRYREQLNEAMLDTPVQSLPHDEIIAKLDEAGKAFQVLLLKTTMTLPYTTVFIQLDCGYWDDEAEHDLRHRINA